MRELKNKVRGAIAAVIQDSFRKVYKSIKISFRLCCGRIRKTLRTYYELINSKIECSIYMHMTIAKKQ